MKILAASRLLAANEELKRTAVALFRNQEPRSLKKLKRRILMRYMNKYSVAEVDTAVKYVADLIKLGLI